MSLDKEESSIDRVVLDPNLTWKAKGLFLFLAMRFANRLPYASQEEIKKFGLCGKTSIRNGLKELTDRGYIKRTCYYSEEDQDMKWETIIFE